MVITSYAFLYNPDRKWYRLHTLALTYDFGDHIPLGNTLLECLLRNS